MEEKIMPKETLIGDIRPIYQQVGWEVCKNAASKPEDEKWVPFEKESDAEILSALLKKKEE